MEHEVLMRSTLTYNAAYILEDCTLEAKFHHKYHNDRDRDRELSLVIKMYYFNIRHTMIVNDICIHLLVLIFWPRIHLELQTMEVVFISYTDILDGIDSPKNLKKRNNSCGKTKIDDYFRSKY